MLAGSRFRLGAGERVVVVDEALQAFFKDVGVDLRRRDIGVAEKLLDRAQIGAAVEEMAGERMAQDVRADALWSYACGGCHLLQFLGEALAGEMTLGARGGEKPTACGRAWNIWIGFTVRGQAQVSVQRFPGGAGERQLAFATTLALDRQKSAIADQNRFRK